MRITNNMLVNNLLSNVNKNLVNMSKMQDQLASGKKVLSASDDPVAAAKIIKYKTDLAQYAQYERNTNDALSWLETTESTMMDINKVLQRAREAAVKAANGTNTDSDVEKIGDELEQLKQQLIMDGNFSFAGRYVFSGYHTEEPLFNEDGTYTIGMTDIDLKTPPKKEYQIGVGEEIEISTNGLDIFGSIAEIGAFIESMPSGSSTDDTVVSKSEIKINLSLDLDHTSTGQITFELDGNNYDVDMTALDLSALDMTNEVDVENARTAILDSVKNAVINPATIPATLLSTNADVSFNEEGELLITSKTFGDFSTSQVGASGFKDKDSGGLPIEGAVVATVGDTVAAASNQSEMIIGFDPTLDHSGSQITYEINGINYDVVMTDLDLSNVNGDDDTEVQEARIKVLNAIKNAEANPPTVPQTTISDTADVFFTDRNELVIRAKDYGVTSMSKVSTTGFYEESTTGTPIEIVPVEIGGISNVSNALLPADNAVEGVYTIATSAAVTGANNGAGTLDTIVSNIDIVASSTYSNATGFQIQMDQIAQAGGTGSETYTFTLVNGAATDTVDVTVDASSTGTQSVTVGDVTFDVDLSTLWTSDSNDDAVADSLLDGNQIDLTVLNEVTMTQVATGDSVVRTVADGAAVSTETFTFLDGGEINLDITDDSGEFVRGDTHNTNVQYGTSGGLVVGSVTANIGNVVSEASLSTGVINDADVGTNFNDKEFVITINGDTQRIQLGTLPDPATVSDLVTAMQSAIDDKFANNEISVTESGGVITFRTNGTTPDGERPVLEILPVKANKSQMIQEFDDVIAAIRSGDRTVVEQFIGKVDGHMEKVLTNLSDIGARTNRMELVISRINENNVTFTKLLSNAQDADMSEVIMYLKNAENVYKASLATGAKVIQPSLIDFLR